MTASSYVDGWKCIAALLERSERWCRAMATREVRPLPVFKFGGIVRLRIADMDRWLAEESVSPAGVAPLVEQSYVRSTIPMSRAVRVRLHAEAKRRGVPARDLADGILMAALGAE